MKMSDLGSEITVKDDRLSMGRVYGLETWKTDDKWNGKPSTRKSYIQRIEGILKRFPEMMATWNSRLPTSRDTSPLWHEICGGWLQRTCSPGARTGAIRPTGYAIQIGDPAEVNLHV